MKVPASRKIKLPPAVAAIYRAVDELKVQYEKYKRPFTPDGHLVGSLGEVIAAETLGLTLHPNSRPGHDAFDDDGDIQIKMTAGKRIALNACCERLVVIQVISPEEAEIIYIGPGEPVWSQAGKAGKNGQSTISLAKLRRIAGENSN